MKPKIENYKDIEYNLSHDYTLNVPNPAHVPNHGDLIELSIGYCQIAMAGGFILRVIESYGGKAFFSKSLGPYQFGEFMHIANCSSGNVDNGFFADQF